jgi:hypothetical protein
MELFYPFRKESFDSGPLPGPQKFFFQKVMKVGDNAHRMMGSYLEMTW